jgi:hypothetical protein
MERLKSTCKAYVKLGWTGCIVAGFGEGFQILRNSMKQSPSWEANSCSTGQEMPRLLWNPKVHYRVHRSLLMEFILSQMSLANTLIICFLKTCFNTMLPSPPRSPNWAFPFSLSDLHALLVSHVCYMPCPYYLPSFDHRNNIWIPYPHAYKYFYNHL